MEPPICFPAVRGFRISSIWTIRPGNEGKRRLERARWRQLPNRAKMHRWKFPLFFWHHSFVDICGFQKFQKAFDWKISIGNLKLLFFFDGSLQDTWPSLKVNCWRFGLRVVVWFLLTVAWWSWYSQYPYDAALVRAIFAVSNRLDLRDGSQKIHVISHSYFLAKSSLIIRQFLDVQQFAGPGAPLWGRWCMWAKMARTGPRLWLQLFWWPTLKLKNRKKSYQVLPVVPWYAGSSLPTFHAWRVLVDFSMFLKEENRIFAKSLAEEVKAAGWISMEILVESETEEKVSKFWNGSCQDSCMWYSWHSSLEGTITLTSPQTPVLSHPSSEALGFFAKWKEGATGGSGEVVVADGLLHDPLIGDGLRWSRHRKLKLMHFESQMRLRGFVGCQGHGARKIKLQSMYNGKWTRDWRWISYEQWGYGNHCYMSLPEGKLKYQTWQGFWGQNADFQAKTRWAKVADRDGRGCEDLT